MSAPLLKAKLTIPPARKSLIRRERLYEKLDRGLNQDCKVILLSAPAGYGKTTLVSSWVRRRHPAIQAAWLTLDSRDNDLNRFLSYLVTALKSIQTDEGQATLEMLKSPQSSPAEAILSTLLNECKSMDSPFLIILDDYHVISSQPVQEAIAFLLEVLPANMHMVICSRSDPLLPLARFRARGQLIDLRAESLRFDTAEATKFLNQTMGLDLSSEEITMLETRTEGWIVGLQLAALSMQGREDIGQFLNAFSGTNRFILDYLVEEVLDRQPEDIKNFLLCTSILERLNASLCDATIKAEKPGSIGNQRVAGPGEHISSQPILEYLEHANLFVRPLDDERKWYCYHHLFADALRSRLNEGFGKEWVIQLHAAACDWYEQNGHIPEAVSHALAAEDYERAALQVRQAAHEMFLRGEIYALIGWMRALPQNWVRKDPILSLNYANGLLATSSFDEVEPHLRDIERVLGYVADGSEDSLALPVPIRGALAEILSIRANLAFHHMEPQRALDLSELAFAYMSEDVEKGLCTLRAALLGVLKFNIGLAHEVMGNVECAEEAFEQSLNYNRQVVNPHMNAFLISHLAKLRIARGQLRQAAETYKRLIDHPKSRPFHLSPYRGLAYVGLGGILYEWNELEEACSFMNEGIQLGKLLSNWETILPGYLGMASIHVARGEMTQALEFIAELAGFAERYTGHLGNSLVDAYKAWTYLAQGDLKGALDWCKRLNIGPGSDLPYGCEKALLIQLEVMIAQGKMSDALNWITRLLSSAQSKGQIGHIIELLLLQAMAFRALGRGMQAYNALESALALTEPEGYIRVFADKGEQMERLISDYRLRVKKEGQLSEKREVHRKLQYLDKLLSAFRASGSLSFDQSAPLRQRVGLIEPLSAREMEVLRLLAIGLSNAQIAEKLIVTTGTVKSHIHSIFGKLGAGSRTQVLLLAKELKLI
jgi:LuxR family maltose regulon positive regulatory protein